MVDRTKVVYVLACGFLLSIAVQCNIARAELITQGASGKDGHSQGTDGQGDRNLSVRQQGLHIIQGDVLRVEGNTYFIKELGGKELSLFTDANTLNNTSGTHVRAPRLCQMD